MALLQLDDLLTAGPKPPLKTVEITPSAVDRVRAILARQPDKAGQGLRLYVTTGGCAGYSYGMAFDEPNPEDVILEENGLKVLVDPDSLQWLKGVRVDYQESMMGSGFSITNPNVSAGCGCGTSFSKTG